MFNAVQRARVARTPLEPGLFLALAPMDGVTDWGFRELITELSGVSLCASEFVRVTDRPVPAKLIRRHCPEVDRGGHTWAGVPVFVQLLGGQAGPMAESARCAVELGAPGIDLNFGCPAKTVNRHDGGASLLRSPGRIEEITRAVRDALPAEVPVSVKLRTGWADSADAPVVARAAEAGGASWLTMHGRTRTDQYGPPANWEAIGRAREAVSIPLVANGDLNDEAAVLRCAQVTQAAGFMLARGSMGRPNLFRVLRGLEPDAPLPAWRLALLLRTYCERMVAAGVAERSALNRLKQWLCYGARAEPSMSAAFEAIKRADELARALDALPSGLPVDGAPAGHEAPRGVQPSAFLAASRTSAE